MTATGRLKIREGLVQGDTGSIASGTFCYFQLIQEFAGVGQRIVLGHGGGIPDAKSGLGGGRYGRSTSDEGLFGTGTSCVSPIHLRHVGLGTKYENETLKEES